MQLVKLLPRGFLSCMEHVQRRRTAKAPVERHLRAAASVELLLGGGNALDGSLHLGSFVVVFAAEHLVVLIEFAALGVIVHHRKAAGKVGQAAVMRLRLLAGSFQHAGMLQVNGQSLAHTTQPDLADVHQAA